MDFFWLIPLLVLVLPLLVVFFAHIKGHPSTQSTPKILLHKAEGEPSIDQATLDRDWSKRPCGSFLDWRSGQD
jgi:hypothetical protein